MNATSERVLKALSRLEAAPAKPANDPVRRRGIELVQVLVRYFHIERDELRFRDWLSIVTEQDRRTINVGRAKPVRYLGPNGERWAGCGKTPRWVREVEEEGGDREDYRIF